LDREEKPSRVASYSFKKGIPRIGHGINLETIKFPCIPKARLRKPKYAIKEDDLSRCIGEQLIAVSFKGIKVAKADFLAGYTTREG